MKIANNQVDSFISGAASGVSAVLIYGPDSGLVSERAKRLAKLVVADLNDPFNVSNLSQGDILNDPAVLSDNLNALSMTGDRRLVMVTDASERLAGILESALEASNPDAVLIMQAGDLKPRNKLRALAETSKTAAALPCYADDARCLDRLIDEVFAAHGVSYDSNARNFLEQNLGSDRGISRSELEKLALYAGKDGSVSFDDAALLVGDNSAMTLSDLAFSTADGDAAGLDRLFSRCVMEDIAPIVILRAVAGHMTRLQIGAEKVRAGDSPDQAMKALRPPVFFKVQDRFRRQLQRWRGSQIAKGLNLLLSAERECKRTGAPDLAICGRTLHQIAALARAAR